MTGPIRSSMVQPDPDPDYHPDPDDYPEPQPEPEDDNDEPEFDPDFDLPEPDPENQDLPKPEREPDLWDQEEGVPADVEDIAIVAYEALRAYRVTQGSGSGRPWLNQTREERDDLVELVTGLKDKPPTKYDGPPEARLVAFIVKALAS